MKRPKLTYANVMSTMAFFLALSGSAVAVSQIDGAAIKPRSIRNGSFKQIVSSSSSTSTAKPKSKAARASAASGSGDTSTIVTADVGQTALLLDVSGLKLWLKCVTVPPENGGYLMTSSHAGVQIFSTTNEDGTVTGYQTHFSGDDVLRKSNYIINKGDRGATGVEGSHTLPMGWYQYFMQAPSGNYMAVTMNFGVGQFRADCWASAFTLQ